MALVASGLAALAPAAVYAGLTLEALALVAPVGLAALPAASHPGLAVLALMLAALAVADHIALVQPLVLAQESVQAMACVAPFGFAALAVP